jgi:hypothetical protein
VEAEPHEAVQRIEEEHDEHDRRRQDERETGHRFAHTGAPPGDGFLVRLLDRDGVDVGIDDGHG